jgi:hypothetical protein
MSGQQPAPNERDPRRIVGAIIDLFQGRSNCAGQFTLTASATTTTVVAPNFGIDSDVVWSPLTANAASAMTNVRLTGRAKGEFTLTHSSTSTTDRTFAYRIIR